MQIESTRKPQENNLLDPAQQFWKEVTGIHQPGKPEASGPIQTFLLFFWQEVKALAHSRNADQR